MYFFFFWILESITDPAAVIPNGAKIFFANGTAVFINGPAVLLKYQPYWIIILNYHIELF